MELAEREAPDLAQELIGPYLRSAGLLGAHTAGLHCALAAATEDASFHREPFSRFYQRSRYQAMRGLTSQVLHTLRRRLDDLPRSIRREARRVLEREDRALSRFRWLLDRRIPACRIRCHGNYHLEQVLVQRGRVHGHRLRGRAPTPARRAPSQAFAPARCGQACCAPSTTPLGGRSRSALMAPPGARAAARPSSNGPDSGVGGCAPRSCASTSESRAGSTWCRQIANTRSAPRRVPARAGHLRAGLRARGTPGMDRDPTPGNSRRCWKHGRDGDPPRRQEK